MSIKAVCAAVTLTIAGTAAAGSSGEWFEKMDANADGYLSTAELGDEKAKKMSKLDTDNDGQISRAEYDDYKAKKDKKR